MNKYIIDSDGCKFDSIEGTRSDGVHTSYKSPSFTNRTSYKKTSIKPSITEMTLDTVFTPKNPRFNIKLEVNE